MEEGYGAFSVSPSNIDAVKDCVGNQPQHHAKRSFESEFIALLGKSGVTFELDKVFGSVPSLRDSCVYSILLTRH